MRLLRLADEAVKLTVVRFDKIVFTQTLWFVRVVEGRAAVLCYWTWGMDATQLIDDSIVESEEEETEEEEESENKKREPLAKLRLLKNAYLPETGERLTTAVTLPTIC